MKIKQKNIILITIINVVIFLNAILLALLISQGQRPRVKDVVINYVLGEQLSQQAHLYLENVGKEETVEVMGTIPQKVGTHQITVLHRNKTYPIRVKVVKPTPQYLQSPSRSSQGIKDFLVGSDYRALFGVKATKNLYFTPPSQRLSPGKHKVTMVHGGEQQEQEVYVYRHRMVLPRFTESLTDVITAFLQANGLKKDQVAVSYYNPHHRITVHFNENIPMLGASTYKLPLAMYTEQQLATVRGTMMNHIPVSTVEDWLERTVVDSNNDTAMGLLEQFGGWWQFVQQHFAIYGNNPYARTATIDIDNYTTSGYFLQVLKYLYQNRQEFPLVTKFLGRATPRDYYETYLQHVEIWHKYGRIENALNDVAIVYEDNPYLVAVYTKDLTSQEFGTLAYVINEWHRLYQNTKEIK